MDRKMREPTCPLPSRAYNLTLLHEEGRPGPGSHGCRGPTTGYLRPRLRLMELALERFQS